MCIHTHTDTYTYVYAHICIYIYIDMYMHVIYGMLYKALGQNTAGCLEPEIPALVTEFQHRPRCSH